MFPTHLLTRAIAALVLVVVPSLVAVAQTPTATRRAIAIGLANEGRCEAALSELRALETDPPSDAEVQRLIGACEIRLQDFSAAVRSLEAARSLAPQPVPGGAANGPGVDLYLAMAYYHLGELESAQASLSRAEATDAQRPEFLLYSGLIAYERADLERAVSQLDAADRVANRPNGPVAPFFLGRALGRAEQGDRAREAYQRVIDGWPGTLWADQAQRALDALDAAEGPTWWATAELGFEFDDNALLRGSDVARPQDISNQSDERGYWFVDFGAMLLRTEKLSLGAIARYGGSENNDLDRFDTHAPGATVWIDRELGIADSSARLQYDFDVAWIDAGSISDDPFVISHLLTGSVFKPWEAGGRSVVELTTAFEDFRYDRSELDVPDFPAGCPNPGDVCSPAGVDEVRETDRDGVGVGLSLRHQQPLPIEIDWLTEPWLEAEYSFSQYWAEGREYDHTRHEIELGIGVVLPLELLFQLSGRYAYVPYDNPTVFPDPKDVGVDRPYFLDHTNRREQETGLDVSLERALGEHAIVSARYSRTRVRSTADVFDYTRDLFGLSVRVGLGG